MKCPHCTVAFNVEFDETETWQDTETKEGYQVAYEHCPDCHNLIVLLQYGKINKDRMLEPVTREELLFPKVVTRMVEPEVPADYSRDYLEAAGIINFSPKASAAVSRRLLQMILREHFKIQRPNLAQEIDAFLQLKDVPSYLSEAVDAIRNIGNFAAHPLKETATNTIVEVEPGEAEWLLEVLESLFDFAFVQPQRLAKRRASLNQKLQSLGKPPMK